MTDQNPTTGPRCDICRPGDAGSLGPSVDEMMLAGGRGIYVGTVRIRRGSGWVIKPEAEVIDGLPARFMCAWRITANDSDLYAGEWAMQPLNTTFPWPVAWVASGDIENLTPDVSST